MTRNFKFSPFGIFFLTPDRIEQKKDTDSDVRHCLIWCLNSSKLNLTDIFTVENRFELVLRPEY